MANTLNAFMDHVLEYLYKGQNMEQKFPALVVGLRYVFYDITYIGSPLKKQRFELNSLYLSAGMTIRISYPSTKFRVIFAKN